MTVERVADMTIDELKGIVSEIVNEKLKQYPRREDHRSLEEVLAAMDRLRWTPPSGAKSTLELLRENRGIYGN